ncbi:MAG TPA: HD domain-containing protein [Longimicrobiales bacterium]|nr:HD domain-containing protein [Longimicrobiales bacterium]
MAERPARRVREWLASAPFPWPPPPSLPDGEVLVACFCVVDARQDTTKGGKPYLRLRLMDRHGPLEARVWDDAERVAAFAEAGSVVGVRGRMETFNAERQLNVQEAAPVEVAVEELDLFLPRSERDGDVMERELRGWIASVGDGALRTLLETLLSPDAETGRHFRQAPAASRNHHAYLGGLLEHTLSVTAACDALAGNYGPVVDRDLLIAGALLHDLGKTREIGTELGFPYTDEGKLLGHIVLGIQMVERAATDVPALLPERRTLLLHLVASHQGRYEWASPREPHTLEALILHYADDLDAKMAPSIARVRGVEGAGWTGYHRALGRDLLRHGGTGAVSEGGGAYAEEAAQVDEGAGTERAAPAADPPPLPPARARPSGRPREDASAHRTVPDDTLDLFGG